MRHLALWMLMLGCAGKSGVPQEASAVDAGLQTLSGELVHVDIDSSVKSVEAYLGEEFVLTLSDGSTRVLRPTADVGRDDLLAAAGRRVTVQVKETPGRAPDPRMQAPTGMNGAPLAQGAGWLVYGIQ